MLLLKDLGLVANNMRRAMRAIATEVIATARWVAVQAGELDKTIRGKYLCLATSTVLYVYVFITLKFFAKLGSYLIQ